MRSEREQNRKSEGVDCTSTAAVGEENAWPKTLEERKRGEATSGDAETGDGVPVTGRMKEKEEFKAGDGGATTHSKKMEDGGVDAKPAEPMSKKRHGLTEYKGALPKRQREKTGVLRMEGPTQGDQSVAENVPDKAGSPGVVMAAMNAEATKGDVVNAKVLQLKVLTVETQRWKAEEEERWRHRAEKRRKHAQRRRAKRALGVVRAVTQGDVLHAVSARKGTTEDKERPRRTDGVTYEGDFEMPEPSCEFREALVKSIAALGAVDEVGRRRDVLVDGFGKLALAEARRMELIAANDWEVDKGTPLSVSRARRRYQQRFWKGRAKALRRYDHERLRQDEKTGVLRNKEGDYRAMDEVRRDGRQRARKFTEEEAEAIGSALPYAENSLRSLKRQHRRQKCYEYHCGSSYEEPAVKVIGVPGKLARVAKLKAARAVAEDLLPTAMVEVKGECKSIKLDTCAQYSVAGKWWQRYGEQLDTVAPVDYMEGFSGTAVKVLGVWRFQFKTQYQQPMVVDTLLVDSDTRDFLVGEDWMYDHGVKIDFTCSEMKWYDGDVKMVVPFSGIGTAPRQGTQAAKVRLIKRAKVHTQTAHNVRLAVAAPEGTTGVFMPKASPRQAGTTRGRRHLLLAPTIATVVDGCRF
jgi:hypothetical protein